MKRLDIGETGRKGRFLGFEARKPLAYERGFLVLR